MLLDSVELRDPNLSGASPSLLQPERQAVCRSRSVNSRADKVKLLPRYEEIVRYTTIPS